MTQHKLAYLALMVLNEHKSACNASSVTLCESVSFVSETMYDVIEALMH